MEEPDNVCKHYIKGGCRFGANCRFEHPWGVVQHAGSGAVIGMSPSFALRAWKTRKRREWVHIMLQKPAEPIEAEIGLVPSLIGYSGDNTKKIFASTGAKVRIRGIGSGHLEVDGIKEAPVPLMMAITIEEDDEHLWCAKLLSAVEQGVKLIEGAQDECKAIWESQGCIGSVPELFYIGEWSPRSEPVLRKIISAHPQPAGVKSRKKPTPGGVNALGSMQDEDVRPRVTTCVKKSAALCAKPSQVQTSCQTCAIYADWQGWPGWHNAWLHQWDRSVYSADDVYARCALYDDRVCGLLDPWDCSWNAQWDGPWDGAGCCESEWSFGDGDAFVDYQRRPDVTNVSHSEPMSPQDEAFMAEMEASVSAFLKLDDDSADVEL